MKNHLKRIWAGPEDEPLPVVYLSGSGGPVVASRFPVIYTMIRHYCMSFFYLEEGKIYQKALVEFKKNGVRCFLDSGAYSAQMQAIRQGKPLTQKTAESIIERYIDYVYHVDFVFDFIVTFDYLRDHKIVLWATERIEKSGLHPVPVYHQGSPISALRDLIDRGYTLIGISLADPRIFQYTKPFLDQVFNITEKHGIRCHGLGSGGRELVNYPWFSVDSTTWLQDSLNGRIGQMPHSDQHLYRKVTISSRKTAVVVDNCGDTYADRVVYNIRFWNELIDKLHNRRKPKLVKSLW